MSRGDPPGLTGARKNPFRGQGVSLALWLACTVFAAFGWGTGAQALEFSITNTAYANFDNEFSQVQPVVASSTSFGVIAGSPNLVVSAMASATAPWDGDPVFFTLAVFNAGDDSAFNVSILDTLPLLVHYAGSATLAADPGWAPAIGPPERLRWTLAQVDIGATAYLYFTAAGSAPVAAVQPGANGVSVHYGGTATASSTLMAFEVWRSAPSSPGSLSALALASSVALSWTPASPGRDPVSRYLIYRSTGSGVPPALLAASYGLWATGYSDNSPVPGATMCYTVRAVDDSGRIGAPDGPECVAFGGVVTPGTVHVTVVVTDGSGRTVKVLADRMEAASVDTVSVAGGSDYLAVKTGDSITIKLSDGTVLGWDARNSGGVAVPNGFYTVTVTSVLANGQVRKATDTFALVREYEELIISASFVPNPAREGVWLSFALASPLAEMTVRIYNIAGELVWKTEVTGASASFKWDLRNRQGTRVSPGLYVAALEARDPATGVKSRKLLRLAVER
jgi:uncharacterized repeat protein (TIGR01451 family)